jgi:hypothetical protein
MLEITKKQTRFETSKFIFKNAIALKLQGSKSHGLKMSQTTIMKL